MFKKLCHSCYFFVTCIIALCIFIGARTSNYPILDAILNRGSQRSFSDVPISHNELMTLFEAARLAPSSYNSQPWRLVYATRDSQEWDLFLGFLVQANASWAKKADILVVVLSQKFDAKNRPLDFHSFDTGAAWGSMAIQAASMNISTVAIGGFYPDKIRTTLNIPEEYAIEVMIAIGRPKTLTTEQEPSDRKPLDELVFARHFPVKK